MKTQRSNVSVSLMCSALAGAVMGLTGCVGNFNQHHHLSQLNQAASTPGSSGATVFSEAPNSHISASLTPGSLVISRPAPKLVLASLDNLSLGTSVTTREQVEEMQLPENALGFVSLPEKVAIAPAKGSLIISRSTGKAHLITNSQDRWLEGVTVSESEGATITPESNSTSTIFTSCQISLKQEDPTWYAPDSYYQRRQMETPAANDGARYLRGVYGDQALFCDASTAVHSSPAGVEEVGGIKIADEDLALVYQSLQIGDTISVIE